MRRRLPPVSLFLAAGLLALLAASLWTMRPADPQTDFWGQASRASAHERELASFEFTPDPGVAALQSPSTSPELEAFFASFDADRDARLGLNEAIAFFEWAQASIVYRYDNENAVDPDPSILIGDGRPGPTYQQTPLETWQERAGDCEDVNVLEAALYLHFGVPAWRALVNADSPDTRDHAIALVPAPAAPEALERILGHVDSYSFDASNPFGLPAGDYLPIDNTYSETYASFVPPAAPDRFRILEVDDIARLLAPPATLPETPAPLPPI